MSESINSSPRFVNLDEAIINRLIDAKLTAAQYRAFLYFSLVDPFGNRAVDTNGAIARSRLGLSKSTYYAAIAKLQDEDFFDFEDVVLRVRNKVGIKAPERRWGASDEGDDDKKYSGNKIVREIELQSEKSNSGSKNRTLVREIEPNSEKSESETLEAIKDNNSGALQYLSLDLNTSLNSSEKEQNQKSKIRNLKSETDFPHPDDSVNDLLNSDKPLSAPKWINFSAPGADPEFFKYVLTLVSKFPHPPADASCAAEGWIQKQGHLLYAKYLAWKEERQRVESLKQVPPEPLDTPPSSPTLDPPQLDAESRLSKYQALWASAVMRLKAEEAIASHPEWGIEIGPDGPRAIAGFVPVSEALAHQDPQLPDPQPSFSLSLSSSPALLPASSLSSVAQVLQQSENAHPPEQPDDENPQCELWDGPSYAAG